jgi:hypothetical protein
VSGLGHTRSRGNIPRSFRKCEPNCVEHAKHLADGTPIDEHGSPLDREGRAILACIDRIYNDYSARDCDRKLKGDPEFPHLCGLHTSVIHRRRAKDEARKQAVAARNEESAAIQTRIDALADLGLDLKASSFSAGRVSVPLRQLEALAEQVRTLQQENLRRRLGEQ